MVQVIDWARLSPSLPPSLRGRRPWQSILGGQKPTLNLG